MAKLNKFAAAIMLSFGAMTVATTSVAAEKCPIEKRKNQAVGQSAGKKIQRSYKAYTEGNIDEALAILLEVDAKKKFDKASVARMLGNFYAEKNQLDKAYVQLKLAADLDVLGGTEHADTLKLTGIIAVQTEKFKDGIKYFNKWLAFSCKEDADIYRLLAASYSQVKDWDNAIKAADKGIKASEKPNKNFYNIKINAYYNKKQLKNAVKVLETAVQLFPSDPSFWKQLAQFYLATEQRTKSLQTYDLAYKAGFIESKSDITRLSQLMSIEAPYHAAKLYEKHMKSGVIEKNETNLKMLAGFYQGAKDFRTAAKYFGEAADLAKDAKLYMKQGQLLTIVQRYADAIKAFNKAIKAGLKSKGKAHFELANAYLGLKQYKSAYNSAKLATKDKQVGKHAKSLIPYIKEKARIHNISL